VLSSVLFLYVGFILLVILANVFWLGHPGAEGDEGYSPVSALFTNPMMRSGLWFSLRLSLVTTLITASLATLLAIPSAYALSRYRFRLMPLLDTIIDLPIVIPPLIAGLVLLVFFRQSTLGRFIDEHVLNIVYTQTGIVVGQFFVASAFAVRALKAIFDQINPRFEGVARTLGCSAWGAIWRVTLPLARNGIAAGFIMTWARALGEFGPILMLAGATPGKTDVLPVSAFLNMSTGNVEIAVTIAVMMIGIATITLILFKRLGGQGYIW